jgi:electron transfer flavoprotein alpha subunit
VEATFERSQVLHSRETFLEDAGTFLAPAITESREPLSNGPRRLRIAALIKQVPVAEALSLDADGRLERVGHDLEMNPYCRRAVSKGVELARRTGGTCSVFTMGPASAEDVLREAVAWGADLGIHLCDTAFAGSDTLATARGLASALSLEGPFDLVLVGRNTVDGDTGQVGPELAQMLGLPFASSVRVLHLMGEAVQAELEFDDGTMEVEVTLPAVLSVAERLCEPAKVDQDGRNAVPQDRIIRRSARELGDGPWGQAGSPTRVGAVQIIHHDRAKRILAGGLAEQIDLAIELLVERCGVLGRVESEADRNIFSSKSDSPTPSQSDPLRAAIDPSRTVAILVEAERFRAARELLGVAREIVAATGGRVVALVPPDAVDMELFHVDDVVQMIGSVVAEDVASALHVWVATEHPWAVLAPSTSYGREVAARLAAASGAGLVGDAIGLKVVEGKLVAAKPAFASAEVADIICDSEVQFVTVRPGVLPLSRKDIPIGKITSKLTPSVILQVDARSRVRIVRHRRTDDLDTLARARVVIGVGIGVPPEEYARLTSLAAIFGAELGATRKVTDNGWAPRSRQIGITGRSISPELYIAIALSGKFNHIVGVRAASTILAINHDPHAMVFDHCDIGLVGDWRTVVPALASAIHRHGVADWRTTRGPKTLDG